MDRTYGKIFRILVIFIRLILSNFTAFNLIVG
jgi:hypothetical protein